MPTPGELVELVTRLFPIAGDRWRVELADDQPPPSWSEGSLAATLRLIVFDDDGSIRDIKEQTVHLLSERHCTERGRVFLEAIAAHARALRTDAVETLMPHDLFPTAALDAPIEVDALARVLADARARTILEMRPEDERLLATLDPRARPPVPVLRNAELEAAILERIDDRAAYAVYGDWLAERGDPRGELVALQIALATRHDDALADRANQLIHDHEWEWLGGLAWGQPGELAIEWRYGFASVLRFGAPEDMMYGRDMAYEVRELARLPGMAFVRAIEILPRLGWGEDAFSAIGRVGVPAALRRLSIKTAEYAHVGDVEPAYPGLARLEELHLESRSFELGAIELPALRSLELVTRGLTRDNLASVRDARWPKLERLVLWLGDEGIDDCDVELDDLGWLFAGNGFPALRHLGLCGRGDALPLVERLVDAPIVKQLEVLDLAGNYLRTVELEHLRAHHRKLAHLRAIHLPARFTPDIVVGPNVVPDDRFIPVYE